MNRFAPAAVLCALLATPAWAVTGSALALNSGTDAGNTASLVNNGYAGTYITLGAPGSVTVTVNAQGISSGGVNPHMNLVVNDTVMGWDVGAGAANYEHTLDLPAGTHFLRAEFNNDGGTSRALTINTLDVSGATIEASSTNALALAAAETYTANYRKGTASLALVGVAPGTNVHVQLKRHEFNFGTTAPNSSVLVANPTPGSTAARFQQALVDNRFNSLAPENDGKWSSNESTRDVQTLTSVNTISSYAQAHDMGFRQHNLIWGPNNQQPSWVSTLLTQAVDDPGTTDDAEAAAAKADLRTEISERIDYYVGDGAGGFPDLAPRYYEIDVYNESYHTGSNAAGNNNYWDIYTPAGIAEIYKEVKDAVAVAGADTRVFVNEYSVLQGQGGDSYANWYARHIEQIQNAGQAAYGENVVTGIGIQYYNNGQSGNHNPARIYSSLQNLAVQGLPMHLTEWGATGGTEANAAVVLEETARLLFGMPGASGLTLWNLRNVTGTFAPVGTLYNSDWSLRLTGAAWQELMAEWDTDLMAAVNSDGTIDFNGFYGDYEITVDGQTYDLSLAKGDTLYSLVVAPGDYNGDGIVDEADYTVWRDALDTGNLRADGNGNEMIDAGDYDIWKSLYGTTYGGGSGAASSVPEPNGMVLAAIVGGMFAGRTSTRRRYAKQKDSAADS
jgi:GH35 family endo-1,4-beta-xylanase